MLVSQESDLLIAQNFFVSGWARMLCAAMYVVVHTECAEIGPPVTDYVWSGPFSRYFYD